MKHASTIDFALIGLVCVAILLISVVFRVETAPHLPLCWMATHMHTPCPGCGLTRSFLSISHAEWGRAWYFNPFGFVFYPLTCWGVLRWPLAQRWPARVARVDGWLTHPRLAVTLMASLWVGWLVRLSLGKAVL